MSIFETTKLLDKLVLLIYIDNFINQKVDVIFRYLQIVTVVFNFCTQLSNIHSTDYITKVKFKVISSKQTRLSKFLIQITCNAHGKELLGTNDPKVVIFNEYVKFHTIRNRFASVLLIISMPFT